MADNHGQKNRLKTFIEYLGISTKAFEESCKLSNGYVSSIRKGIGYRAIEQITEHYPDLNPIWLMAGEGSMLLSEEKKQEEKQTTIPSEMLETLYNEARDEKKKLLSIIENQQDIIKKQNETILSQQRIIENLERGKDIAGNVQDAHAG